MDINDAEKELEQIDGVWDVCDGSTGSVQAIDFRLDTLERPTDMCNYVFRRVGTSFQGGLLRLPRLPKADHTEAEVESAIYDAVPAALHDTISIRLDPEVSLDTDYYYPHIELNGTVRDALEVTEAIASNYSPP